jgi:type IV fimbrial biogenesis protein FimT
MSSLWNFVRTASHSGHARRALSASSKFPPLRSPPMSGMSFKYRSSGFTMFELVIVMVIVAILAAVGLPSFKYVTTSNRIASELNGLVGDLQFARSEAVKEGVPITVCVSTDGANCAAGDSAWESGWIVFTDSNGNNVVDAAAGEKVLRAQKAFSAAGSTDTLTPTNTAFQAVRFNREGFAVTGVAAVVNLALHSAPVNNQWTRCLAVSAVGALVVEKYGDVKFGTGPSCS